MLKGAGMLGAAMAVSAGWARRLVASVQVGPSLSITLKFADGTSLSFDEAHATDLGDYVGAFVRQKCLRQRSGAWTIFFRPDANGRRQEIVVEYGTTFDFSTVPPKAPVTPAHITAPYTATISQNGTVVATITVPKHWWGARWRWQSAPRPLVRTYADLVAMKAILPLSASAAWAPSTAAVPWSGPMGTAGLDTSMPTTGDRPEIGFITEAQANFLVTGGAAGRTTMLSQAEAMGSVPIWVRDAATGALFDVKTHPYLSQRLDAFRGAHQIPIPSRPTVRDFFETDAAHFPPLSFVPWLLTDDPFHLEGCMAAALYSMTESNWWQDHEKLPGLVAVAQQRGQAWGWRDVLRMVGFAASSLPSWLLPQSVWRACAADNLTFANRFLSATASPCTTVFGLMPHTAFFSSFMVDYHTIVAGWVEWSGLFPSWSPVVAYVAKTRLAMSDNSGVSGWDYRFPVPYTVPVADANRGARATREPNNSYKQPASPDTPASWARLWSNYLLWENAQPGAAKLDPSTWAAGVLVPSPPATNYGYHAEARGALAALALAGLPNARSEHDWLFHQLQRILGASRTLGGYKWAIWPG